MALIEKYFTPYSSLTPEQREEDQRRRFEGKIRCKSRLRQRKLEDLNFFLSSTERKKKEAWDSMIAKWNQDIEDWFDEEAVCDFDDLFEAVPREYVIPYIQDYNLSHPHTPRTLPGILLTTIPIPTTPTFEFDFDIPSPIY